MEDGRRKLAAILFTDMVGYTSIAQSDEELALGLVGEQSAILRSILRQHHGREVKTVGDAFLIEFESALEAVLCGIEIQSTLRTRNLAVSDEKRISLRLGVHIGDVVYRGDDIFGDAVNLASRIQGAGSPGTICISEDVYSQVRNKINYPVEKIPNQHFKNVEGELNVYKIILPWEGKNSAEQPSRPASNRVAVVPFTNISPDPGDGYFTDGLTDELISRLSEIRELRVVARTSVQKFRGIAYRASAIGKELGVAYLLDGSVRKAGDKIRVSVQLVDCQSEEPVWSNRYDRKLEDLFEIQSEIAMSVADSLKIALLSSDMARVEKKDTENIAAYAAYLKGRNYLHERTQVAIQSARQEFLRAVKEDPSYAKAYAGLADSHMLLGDYLFSPVPDALEMAKMYIDKALELDPDIAEALVSLGNYLTYQYSFAEAERALRRAIALNPSYATGHHWYANLLEHFGKSMESLAEIRLAEQLDPLSASITMSAIYSCLQAGKLDEAQKRIRKLEDIDEEGEFLDEAHMTVNFVLKDWKEAMNYVRRMLERDPEDPFLIADEGYIYAVTGDTSKALETIERLKQIPKTSRIRCSMIAFLYSGLGNIDKCFEYLERGFEERELFFGWYRLYPLFEDVRKDPRFARFLRRANLPLENEKSPEPPFAPRE